MAASPQYVVVVLIVDENEGARDAEVLQYSHSSEMIPIFEFERTRHSFMNDGCTLVRKGRLFSLEDKLVVPYLYSTTIEKRPKFNTKPLRETRSSLQKYLRLFLPPKIVIAIKDIAEDHDSGARQLALKALSTLKLCMTIYNKTESSWMNIVNCAWYITQARPSMGSAIYTTILRALDAVRPTYPLGAIEKIDQLIDDEKHFLKHLSMTFTDFITAQFPSQKEEDRVNILTLSNSSTILAALTHLFQSSSCPCITLNILESRPLLEGVALAKLLLPHKPSQVSIALATDASAAYLSSRCQVTILGCDHLDPETGNVKNKIGSVTAARFAQRTICVTSTDKLGIVKDDAVEENDPEEVRKMWNERLEGVAIRNVYFEWVAGADVEGYVTERGMLGKKELMEISWVRDKWEQIWEVLD